MRCLPRSLVRDFFTALIKNCFQVAEDISEDRFGSQELQQLAEDMIEIMRDAPGVGLAAPQIGIGQKVLGPGRLAQAIRPAFLQLL